MTEFALRQGGPATPIYQRPKFDPYPQVEIPYKAAGHRLLVQHKLVKDVSDGGIILGTDQVERDTYRTSRGKVVDIGPTAYLHPQSGQPITPWCKLGEEVLFPVTQSLRFTVDGPNGEKVVLQSINDDTLLAICVDE